MIYPLAPTHNGSSNYIDQTCYIPVIDNIQLQNYYSHTVLRDTVHKVFIIRTSKTIISLKENGYIQDFLSKKSILLSQTNWPTEKEKNIFFVFDASEILTRRDDLKTAIRESMSALEHFGLFPQRKTIYIENQKVVYRALIIDSLESRTDYIKDQVAQAFASGDTRLDGLRVVPVSPTADVDKDMIAHAASKYNGTMKNSIHPHNQRV